MELSKIITSDHVLEIIFLISTSFLVRICNRIKIKIILLFSLFLLLFIDLTTHFDISHKPHCTISTNFYIYLQYFQQ